MRALSWLLNTKMAATIGKTDSVCDLASADWTTVAGITSSLSEMDERYEDY